MNNRAEYKRQKRKEAIEILGGKCYDCGFSNKLALQIDHIDNNGKEERKKRVMMHNKIINNPIERKKYQVLCANCNWIKEITRRK